MPRDKRAFKDAIYEQLARIGKAAASPRRLELLDLLGQGPRSVEALANETNQSVANVSQHLQVLRAARLVDAKKDGLYVTYRLADEGVAKFFLTLRELAESRLEEIAEVAQSFFEARDALEPVDRDVLVERVRSGEVTVLDVRPAEEFHAGHIPGAVSIPVAELKRRLASLPKYREVVAYCRGPYCVFAVDAVKVLRDNGFKAVRMDEGVLEWRARGLPIEVTQVPS
jgi:rhodanese-related sulfurtransferase/DNA-binding transcriptional ArsR family regulator